MTPDSGASNVRLIGGRMGRRCSTPSHLCGGRKFRAELAGLRRAAQLSHRANNIGTCGTPPWKSSALPSCSITRSSVPTPPTRRWRDSPRRRRGWAPPPSPCSRIMSGSPPARYATPACWWERWWDSHTGTKRLPMKEYQAKEVLDLGAEEIDMVMNIPALKNGERELFIEDVAGVVNAAAGRRVKVILETCYLTRQEKQRACEWIVEGGAHFVKTSTAYAEGGATLEDVGLMYQAREGPMPREGRGRNPGALGSAGIPARPVRVASAQPGRSSSCARFRSCHRRNARRLQRLSLPKHGTAYPERSEGLRMTRARIRVHCSASIAAVIAGCARATNLLDPGTPGFSGEYAPRIPDPWRPPHPHRHLQHQARPPDRPRHRGPAERQPARCRHPRPGGDGRCRRGPHRPGAPPQLRLLPGLHPPHRSQVFRPGVLSRWPIERSWKLFLPHEAGSDTSGAPPLPPRSACAAG